MDVREKNLDLVMRFLGWGDPAGGLWFIGIEEGIGGAWKPQANIQETFQNPRYRHVGDAIYQEGADTGPIGPSRFSGWTGTRVPLWTARVASACIGNWQTMATTYRDNRLWLSGSKTFNGNLWPLSKAKDLHGWPPDTDYPALFGVGPEPDEDYRTACKQRRWRLLREFRVAMEPQAIVCFGSGNWQNFRLAFRSSEQNEREVPGTGGRVRASDSDRMIFSYFFGQGISRADVDPMANVLREWGVRLPSGLE